MPWERPSLFVDVRKAMAPGTRSPAKASGSQWVRCPWGHAKRALEPGRRPSSETGPPHPPENSQQAPEGRAGPCPTEPLGEPVPLLGKDGRGHSPGQGAFSRPPQLVGHSGEPFLSLLRTILSTPPRGSLLAGGRSDYLPAYFNVACWLCWGEVFVSPPPIYRTGNWTFRLSCSPGKCLGVTCAFRSSLSSSHGLPPHPPQTSWFVFFNVPLSLTSDPMPGGQGGTLHCPPHRALRSPAAAAAEGDAWTPVASTALCRREDPGLAPASWRK